MARRPEHERIGTLTGAGAALLQASGIDPAAALLETIGGGLGGRIGGVLADLAEPATWPGHRQFAHSVTCAGAVVQVAATVAGSWAAYWRARAESLRAAASLESDPTERLLLGLQAVVAHLLAGFLIGLVAGHFSHLVLDSQTSPLPLVGHLA